MIGSRGGHTTEEIATARLAGLGVVTSMSVLAQDFRRAEGIGPVWPESALGAPTAPIPGFLLLLRARAAAFAHVAADDLVQAPIIRHETGAGIGWHKDRPEQDAVIGKSLGDPVTMHFRRKRDGSTNALQTRCGLVHLPSRASPFTEAPASY